MVKSTMNGIAAFVVISYGGSNKENTYSLVSFQLPEKAVFQIKQYNSVSHEVSGWQLEEAQVFWAKKEQSLALNILKQMIKKLDASCSEVSLFLLSELVFYYLLRKHDCVFEHF